MIYQVWFSENVLPVFTEDNKEVYKTFNTLQVFPVGKEFNGRRLIRGLFPLVTDSEHEDYLKGITEVMDYLSSLGKEPIICAVADEQGVSLGQQVSYNEDDETYNLLGNAVFPVNSAEYNKYFQPYELEGETVTPVANTAAGWVSFKEIKL